MPEQGYTGPQSGSRTSPRVSDDLAVPPTVLARWAAIAGQLAAAGHLPTQSAAA